jgi:hypothetical protein
MMINTYFLTLKYTGRLKAESKTVRQPLAALGLFGLRIKQQPGTAPEGELDEG